MLSLCVLSLCVKLLCKEAGGEEREEEKEPGIQNQKQEPHTKLWGNNFFNTHLFSLDLLVMWL